MNAFLTSTAGVIVNVFFIFAKKSAIEKLLQKTFEVNKVITLEHRKLQNRQLAFQSRGINISRLQRDPCIHSRDQKLSGKRGDAVKNSCKNVLKISSVDRLVKEKTSFVLSQDTILLDNYTLLSSGSLSSNEISNVESYKNEKKYFTGFDLPSLSWIETMTLRPTLLAIDPTWKVCLTVMSRIIMTALINVFSSIMFKISEPISTVRFALQNVCHCTHIYIYDFLSCHKTLILMLLNLKKIGNNRFLF